MDLFCIIALLGSGIKLALLGSRAFPNCFEWELSLKGNTDSVWKVPTQIPLIFSNKVISYARTSGIDQTSLDPFLGAHFLFSRFSHVPGFNV